MAAGWQRNYAKVLIGAKRPRISGVMLDCLGLVDLQVNGKLDLY